MVALRVWSQGWGLFIIVVFLVLVLVEVDEVMMVLRAGVGVVRRILFLYRIDISEGCVVVVVVVGWRDLDIHGLVPVV